MTLVVQSQETIGTLEKMVLSSFTDVPNNGLEKESIVDFFSTFDLGEFHKLVKVQTLTDYYNLDLHWMLRPLHKEFKCKPLAYLEEMVGHESEGSLAEFLRQKSWAVRVYAYANTRENNMNDYTTHSEFEVSIDLTKSGFDAIDQVCTAVFSYLKMLAHEGPKECIFNEIKEIKDLQFKFRDEPEPTSNVEELSQSMQKLPTEFLFTGPRLVYDYNPQLIQECMDALTPDKVCLVLSSNKFSNICDRTEPWNKAKYALEDIPPKWEESWKNVEIYPEFNLPEPNIFIAKDVTLKAIEPTKVTALPERYVYVLDMYLETC